MTREELKELWQARPEYLNEDQEGHEDFNKGWNACMKEWSKIILDAPTTDTESVRHGKWILKGVREPLPRDYPPCYEEDGYDEETHSIIEEHWFCSVCDYDASNTFKPKDNYCSNCGAKMSDHE